MMSSTRWSMDLDESFHNTPAPGEDASWSECRKLVRRYDEDMCKKWNEELQTMLLFAGLFSAVLTAFVILSVSWLMQTPEDQSAEYLRQMLAIMKNSSDIPIPSDAPALLSKPTIVLVNGLWFSSLTLSLTAALVGIISKQWLAEYLEDTERSESVILAIRQDKYEGLRRWRVGAIISALPLLLQVALAIFMIGILELLWRLDTRSAVAVSVICALSGIFFLVTTMLPALQCLSLIPGLDKCALVPFRSPQSLLFLLFCELFHQSHRHSAYRRWSQVNTFRSDNLGNKDAFIRTLGFIWQTFSHPMLPVWFWNCLWSVRSAGYVEAVAVLGPHLSVNELLELDNLVELLEYELLPALVHVLLYIFTKRVPDASATVLEHAIRIFNTGLDCYDRTKPMPLPLLQTLRTALQGLNVPPNKETKVQLYLIAQDLVTDVHNNKYYMDEWDNPYMEALYKIILLLGQCNPDDASDADEDDVRRFDQQLAGDFLSRLRSLSSDGHSLNYTLSLLLWSGSASVVMSRSLQSGRFASFGSSQLEEVDSESEQPLSADEGEESGEGEEMDEGEERPGRSNEGGRSETGLGARNDSENDSEGGNNLDNLRSLVRHIRKELHDRLSKAPESDILDPNWTPRYWNAEDFAKVSELVEDCSTIVKADKGIQVPPHTADKNVQATHSSTE